MKKKIAVIGGGPAAMMLCTALNTEKFEVTIFEKMPTIGRKFLVAGKGGFNLTHSENRDALINRYVPASFFKPIINSFDNERLRKWLSNLGIETFVGTSKRVFPIKGIKPIDVLSAIKKKMFENDVEIETNHEWLGWNHDNKLRFKTKGGEKIIDTDLATFSLGGASWAKTGSDGNWTKPFIEKGINMLPFQPSNCAYRIDWAADFILKNEGKPLKNISIRSGESTKKGEVVITKFGLEGGAIYALSPEIRKQLNTSKKAAIFIDLKPTLKNEEIVSKLSLSRKRKSWTEHIRNQLRLGKSSINLLKSVISKQDFTDIESLSFAVKNLPLTINDFAPIDEAISTVGGVDLNEIDENFQLKRMPHHFVIGEMLDWDAPTGGYLLQGCFSMGKYLADHLNKINI